MFVDDIGDVMIMNDGVMILKFLEIEYSAAKILVEFVEL